MSPFVTVMDRSLVRGSLVRRIMDGSAISRVALGLAIAFAAASSACSDDEPSDTTESSGLSPGGATAAAGSTGQAGSGPSGASGSGGAPIAAGGSGGEAPPVPTGIDPGTDDGEDGTSAGAADAGTEGPVVADAGAPPNETAFNPCPTDGSPCRIMPLGDSITFGIGSPDGAGYRLDLFEQAVTDGHAVTMVGRVQAGPNSNVQGQQFPTNNEGYSGAQISTGMNQIADRADAALAANPPHIILLQIGTNNLYQGMPPEVPGQLAALLDQITEGAPDALLVVAQITPLAEAGAQFNFPANGVDEYNALIPDIVQERVDVGKHLALVNMNAAFRAANANVVALLSDGIHPNAAGYDIMAQTWYAAIESVLP